MHFTRLARLDDDAELGAGAVAHQVVMHGGRGEERGHRRVLGVRAAVAQDDEAVLVLHGDRREATELVEGRFQAGSAVRDAEQHRKRRRLPLMHDVRVAQLRDVLVREDRVRQLQHLGLIGELEEQVPLRADVRLQAQMLELPRRRGRRGSAQAPTLPMLFKARG